MPDVRKITLDLIHGIRDRMRIPDLIRESSPFQRISEAYWTERCKNVSPMSVRIRDANADFIVETKHEYGRCQTLMGEREALADLLETVEPGDVFWDVGANVGTYSLLVSSLPIPARVHAFEPHPRMARRLRENAELNEAGLKIHPIGLWDESIQGTITSPDAPVGLGTPSVSKSEEEGFTVELRTGDELIEDGLPRPDVLKIDVEGAEVQVIAGMEKTLSKEGACRFILVEVHREGSDTGGGGQGIRRFLEDCGYDVELRERANEALLIGTR